MIIDVNINVIDTNNVTEILVALEVLVTKCCRFRE